MRLHEFKINEEDVARKFLREKYPHLTEEQIDEVLPAVLAPAIAGAKVIGTGLATAGRVGAKLGQAALKTGGKLAVQGAKALGKGALNVGKDIAKQGTQLAQQGLAKTAQAGKKVANNVAQNLAGDDGGGIIGGDNPAVMQKQKQTKQAQLKAITKQFKADSTALKKQIASMK
jgi:hypothetical protein|tara:strand:- start:639 stop:1157 length:519 start_codon:yes stop_codon:yes gene_type:complete